MYAQILGPEGGMTAGRKALRIFRDGDAMDIRRMDVRATTVDMTYRLEDYLSGEDVFMTGTQALVRLPIEQARLDRAAGHDTAGFITGYRGSPLAAYDTALTTARKPLETAGITFRPAVNEDLAATALFGTQEVATDPLRTKEGVFGILVWQGTGCRSRRRRSEAWQRFGASRLGRAGAFGRRPWVCFLQHATSIGPGAGKFHDAGAAPRQHCRLHPVWSVRHCRLAFQRCLDRHEDDLGSAGKRRHGHGFSRRGLSRHRRISSSPKAVSTTIRRTISVRRSKRGCWRGSTRSAPLPGPIRWIGMASAPGGRRRPSSPSVSLFRRACRTGNSGHCRRGCRAVGSASTRSALPGRSSPLVTGPTCLMRKTSSSSRKNAVSSRLSFAISCSIARRSCPFRQAGPGGRATSA